MLFITRIIQNTAMLDPKILRKDTAMVIQNLKRRGYVFDELLWNELEEKRKKLQGFTEEQQAELNLSLIHI